jgi:hypothetical protein
VLILATFTSNKKQLQEPKFMRSTNPVVSSLVMLAIASSLLYAVLPAAGTTYAPGVSAGNYVKYGTVSASFSSNVSSTPTPQFIKDFQATSFFRLDVIGVSGTNATEKWTATYNNGTVLTEGINWDVQSLTGNVTSLKGSLFPIPLLVAAGLTTSDKLCTGTNCSGSSTPPSFNSTQARTYAGASRNNNVITITQTSGGASSSITAYWDQSTGAFMEFSLSFTQPLPGSPPHKDTYSFSTAATETNIWSATILGLSPIVFYGIIGAIVAIVVIVAAVMVMKMRKPNAPAMPAATGTTTPP